MMRLCHLALLAATAALSITGTAAAAPPQTGFEQRNGSSWTTHDEEIAFLSAVGASPRVAMQTIQRTKGNRPMHLVEIGHPRPRGALVARGRPTLMLVCSQHGNEPAGREACLRQIRDLAFTADPGLTALLLTATVIVVPSANPDGRAGNTRENADGIDVNRDHVTLETREAQAIAAVVREWQPDVSIDLHEYGSVPVVYDDSVLWLWPRNLNTDQQVHDMAIELGRQYLVPSANAEGYTTDEYGQFEVVDNDVMQTAGDGDEGIMRNAMGLRHSLGILVETRVDGDPRSGVSEIADTAAVQRRRVDSHMAILAGALKFMAERGPDVVTATGGAALRKAAEGATRSAPVYFGGADNDPATAAETQNPPPCGYRLSPEAAVKHALPLHLHGISVQSPAGWPFVTMGQAAEPLIPLLLDRRGARSIATGEALSECPAVAPQPAPSVQTTRCSRRVRVKLPRVRGRVLSATVRGNGRATRVRRGRRSATVTLRAARGKRARVTIVQRVRRNGRTVTVRSSRTYRVCR